MLATFVIGSLLFLYAGFMLVKMVKNMKRALKGEGCAGCDGSCQDCNVISHIEFK